jgi:hypothetical protein
MSPIRNRKPTTERKTVLAINIVAYSFLYLFTIAFGFLSWKAFSTNDLKQFAIYVTTYFIFLAVFILVVRDIYSNYQYFVQKRNVVGVRLMHDAHFLCADPMCPRCGGWYIGVGLSLAITAYFATTFRDVMTKYPYSGIFLIVIGCSVFALATPIHASMNFLEKFHEKALGSKRLKLLFGFISGLSLFLIAVGILILM